MYNNHCAVKGESEAILSPGLKFKAPQFAQCIDAFRRILRIKAVIFLRIMSIN
jgi:hypothetical protein